MRARQTFKPGINPACRVENEDGPSQMSREAAADRRSMRRVVKSFFGSAQLRNPGFEVRNLGERAVREELMVDLRSAMIGMHPAPKCQ